MFSPDERDATPFVGGQSHCLANNAANAIITLSAVYALEMAASYRAVVMKTRQPSHATTPRVSQFPGAALVRTPRGHAGDERVRGS
jgi:hypothetical protein